jgi:hypothetical protein
MAVCLPASFQNLATGSNQTYVFSAADAAIQQGFLTPCWAGPANCRSCFFLSIVSSHLLPDGPSLQAGSQPIGCLIFDGKSIARLTSAAVYLPFRDDLTIEFLNHDAERKW